MKTSKLKKTRIENTQDFKGDKIKVFKSHFEIYEHLSGYYSIALNGGCGNNIIFGGDSAWDDCYDKKTMKNVFNEWDGVLVYTGEKYGYRIEL